MKRLTILYGDFTVFDADVAECEIKDTISGITVIGKNSPPKAARRSGGDLSGLLGSFAAARKQAQEQLEDTSKTDLADVLESEV